MIEFWFSTQSESERMTCSNSFFHNLFKGDNFPKDYFMFLLRVMQIFKALKSLGQLKIEIEKISPAQPVNSPSKCCINVILKNETRKKLNAKEKLDFCFVFFFKFIFVFLCDQFNHFIFKLKFKLVF